MNNTCEFFGLNKYFLANEMEILNKDFSEMWKRSKFQF